MSENNESGQGWKLDKHIPIALILALIGQSAVFVWGASNLWTRVGNIEDYIKANSNQGEKIAVIQEKVTTLQGTVNRLEEWLRHNVTTK